MNRSCFRSIIWLLLVVLCAGCYITPAMAELKPPGYVRRMPHLDVNIINALTFACIIFAGMCLYIQGGLLEKVGYSALCSFISFLGALVILFNINPMVLLLLVIPVVCCCSIYAIVLLERRILSGIKERHGGQLPASWQYSLGIIRPLYMIAVIAGTFVAFFIIRYIAITVFLR